MPRESTLAVKSKLLEVLDTNAKLSEENARLHRVNQAAVLRTSHDQVQIDAQRIALDELRAALAECQGKKA